jgi:hypothetical protein
MAALLRLLSGINPGLLLCHRNDNPSTRLRGVTPAAEPGSIIEWVLNIDMLFISRGRHTSFQASAAIVKDTGPSPA